MKLKYLIFFLITTFLFIGQTNAQEKRREYRASAIEVLNDSAAMHYHKNYFITVISGTVGSEGIPSVIRVGDRITVKDRTLKANYILATECLERMEWGGEVHCEAGQVYCVVVERPEDIPSEIERNRQWIYVKHCRVLQ